jgi:hypothetical protein
MTVSKVTDSLVSSSDMWAIKGMSKGRLDRWCKAGYVVIAHATGNRKFYHPRELDVARVMVALIDAGVTPEAAAHAARNNGWLSSSVRVVIGSADSMRKWSGV